MCQIKYFNLKNGFSARGKLKSTLNLYQIVEKVLTFGRAVMGAFTLIGKL